MKIGNLDESFHSKKQLTTRRSKMMACNKKKWKNRAKKRKDSEKHGQISFTSFHGLERTKLSLNGRRRQRQWKFFFALLRDIIEKFFSICKTRVRSSSSPSFFFFSISSFFSHHHDSRTLNMFIYSSDRSFSSFFSSLSFVNKTTRVDTITHSAVHTDRDLRLAVTHPYILFLIIYTKLFRRLGATTYSVASENGMPMKDGERVSVYISMPVPLR